VSEFDLWLLAFLAVVVAVGVWGVWWARAARCPGRAAWGRRLFVGTLVALGAGNLFALTCAARCLVPFGLSAGWLVIAMLWEKPFRGWSQP
jgi:hypothetical protein